MRICFITFRYPGKYNKTDFVFVKNLVDAIAALGNDCHVIAPFSITHYHRFSSPKEKYTQGKGTITVYRPGYLSFSKFHIGKFRFSDWTHKRAIHKAFRMLIEKPDIIYGHFWNSAYDGYDYARQNNIPLFVATGESKLSEMFHPKANQTEFSNYVSGVICVSSKNRDESIAMGLTTANKCAVFPNAIEADLFRKMDKNQCRGQIGIPQNVFVVAFVGWFNERKGIKRVSEAIKTIKGQNVYSFFIGKGELEPDCENILFKGSLPHNQIPIYLNAADVFVLPTLHEGCCNAIVEALACGLPIVSSDLPFNWDVLDETNSIMVDPNNLKEIASAISVLRDNKELREQLSKGALHKAESLTISQRANAIMKFIESKI